jgi:hypothetical protein
MAVSETQLPALLRDDDGKPRKKNKPHIRAKLRDGAKTTADGAAVYESPEAAESREWYEKAFREAGESEPIGGTFLCSGEALERLVSGLEEGEDISDVLREAQQLADEQETALREAEEARDFAIGMVTAANEELVHLREYAEGYGLGRIEGVPPRISNGITQRSETSGLLDRMGIASDLTIGT